MTDASPPPAGSLEPNDDLEQGASLQPRFNADGLIGAIVTDQASGEVLMFAWMNADALRLSLETGLAHFWSRSRGRLWQKGEDSGNLLAIREARIDCDQDAIWLKVTIAGRGVACHTGARSCFYRKVVTGAGGTATLVRDNS